MAHSSRHKPRRHGFHTPLRPAGPWANGPIPVVGLVGGIGAGKSVAAAALADGLLSSPESAERAAAVRIAASVAAHEGNANQAAELFSWLGPQPDAVVGAAAAIVLTGTGDLRTARDALRLKDSGPPTMAARTSRSLAEGLLLTMDQPYPAAMTKLTQAVAAEQSMSEVIPDSPVALIEAALAGGATLADAGAPMDAADLVVLSLPAAQVVDGAVVAHVRYVDRFGNLQLNVRHEDLAQSGLRLGRAATIAGSISSAIALNTGRSR